MKVVRERPCQRRFHRVTAPIGATREGCRIRIRNWSLGGFLADTPAGPEIELGQEAAYHLSIPFQGFFVSYRVIARTVRVDVPEGTFAVEFLDLDDRQKALMSHFIEELVRGSMVPVEDTIQRIDVPVTPVSTKPDTNPKNEIPVRRWPLKTIGMSVFYLFLGAFVFSYVGLAIYSALFHMQVDTAVISAETVDLTSPSRGRILDIRVVPQQVVKRGEILMRMQDQDLDEDVRDAMRALALAEAELEEQEILARQAAARAKGYNLIARNNIAQMKSQIRALRSEIGGSRRQLAAQMELRRKGWTTQSQVDIIRSKITALESELERKDIHLNELETLYQETQGDDLFTGGRFVGEKIDTTAAVVRARGEVAAARQTLALLKESQARLIVRASWPARVVAVTAAEGNFTRQGDAILTLEQVGTEHVRAFVAQTVVGDLRIGDSTRVFLRAKNTWVDGVIREINRTEAFFDEVSGDYQWRDKETPTAIVEIGITEVGVLQTGEPALVIFEKSTSLGPIRLLQSWLN